MVGKLRVTVTFEMDVEDLKHFDAETMQDAAVNLAEWYDDGTADLVGDLAASENEVVTVEAVAY